LQGHLSDYQGYSRKYDSFFPLKPAKSINEAKFEIREIALNDQTFSMQLDSDEDVSNENALYEKATQRYEALARAERTRKNMIHNNTFQVKDGESVEVNLRVVFPGKEDKTDSESLKHQTDCVLCYSSKDSDLRLEEPLKLPSLNVKWHEEDEDSIQDYLDEEVAATGKRRSRRAEIANQKKASARILSEMLHTLEFIEEYNNGFQSEKDDEDEDDDVGDEDETDLANEDGGSALNRKRRSKASLKRDGKKARPCMADDDEELELEACKPPFEPLTHEYHLERYADFVTQSRSMYRIESTKDISKVKEDIFNLLNTSTFLEELCADEDVTAEEKWMTKGIRGYMRKAEQEKLEKREFEEKRQYRLGLGLGLGLGKRKRMTPQEREWKEIAVRPFHCITDAKKMPKNLEGCLHKQDCFICAPVLHAERPYEKDDTIFNPSFRRVEEDVYLESCGELGNRSGNRKSQRESQQNASILKLSELFHTFQFIEKYNEGMIKDA
jgi:hypothetical protein